MSQPTVVRKTSFRAEENNEGEVTSLVLALTITQPDGTTPVSNAAVSVAIAVLDRVVFSSTVLTYSTGKVSFSHADELKTGTWTGGVADVTKCNHSLDSGVRDLKDEIDIQSIASDKRKTDDTGP